MKRYPKYKISEIDDSGFVPEGWIKNKISYCFSKIGSGTTPTSGQPEYYDDGEISWLQTGDLNDGVIYTTSKKITEKALLDFSALKFFPLNSIVIAMYGATIGKLGILKLKTTTNQACCVLSEPKSVNEVFVYYWLFCNRENIISMSYGGGQPNINQDIIRSLKLYIPPLPQQHQIVAFLDEKTALIDSLIQKKQRKIELLKEQRTAIINQAVTKGLNPDVKMKDSGVEWIGEIPEHWECKKIKRLTPVRRGASPRPIDDPKYFNDDGEYSWVRIADLTASERYLVSTTQKLSDLGSSLSIKRYPGDLFLSIAGTVGKPIISKIKCCIHDGFVYFPNLKMNPEYLYYIFSTGLPYQGLGKWGTQLNLNTDTVGDIFIPQPPENEIIQIIEFLDNSTLLVESQIATENQKIRLLNEYRQSLISEVVTGKIDVRIN